MSKPAIIPTTQISVIRRATNAKLATVKQGIFATLVEVGEQCIKKARDAGSYKDQTGNLRSSIGYTILNNGAVYRSAIAQKTKNGDEGIAAANALLPELQSKYKKGIVLVVSAGMHYAVYVESRGLDVLTSAELLAERLVKELLDDLAA